MKHPTSVRVTVKGNALILVEVYKYKSQIYKTYIKKHIFVNSRKVVTFIS